jgi:hypothetical protein
MKRHLLLFAALALPALSATADSANSFADAAKKHRVAHMHHDHHPQMQAWRQQAAELIAARDMRESALASRRNGDQVMADLRRRAGMGITAQGAPQLASGRLPTPN